MEDGLDSPQPTRSELPLDPSELDVQECSKLGKLAEQMLVS